MSAARIAPSRRAGVLALAAALAAAPGARGAGEYLVQDLGQTIVLQGTEASFPLHAVLDGIAYFYKDDGIHGRELWRSDGTPLGTFMLRDNCPGACGSESYYFYGVLAATAGHVYFTADDGVHGREPWVTDGTALGTRMIADLAPGRASSYPDLYRAALGQVFFQADDGVHGWDLWRTDGTAAGTYRIPPPDPPGNSAWIRGLHLAGGLLYLNREDGTLLRTDGTAAGTISLLVDAGVYPYAGFLRSTPFADLPGGDLLFQACQPGTGGGDCELWRSDGTVAGTQRVADLEPGPAGSWPVTFTRLGDEVIFETQGPIPYRLYRTDGTEPGTIEIPLPPGVTPQLAYGRSGVVGDRLYFAGCDGTYGCEPWIWDGVTATLLADLAPGPTGSLVYTSLFSSGSLFADVGAVALFFADDGSAGLQLWRSDGTAGGTSPISDLGAPPAGSYLAPYQDFAHPIVTGDRLLFSLYRPDRGLEIWASDGTASGTGAVRTIADRPSAFVGGRARWLYARPFESCFAAGAEGLFFAALGSDPLELLDFYFTTGQAGQVELLRASLFEVSSLGPSACATSASSGLALAGTDTEQGLWLSDGTAAGTDLFAPLDLTGGLRLLPAFGHQNDRVYFGVGPAETPDAFVFRPGPAGPELRTLGPLTTVSWGQVIEADEHVFFGGSSGLEVTDGAAPPIPIYGDPVPPLLLDLDDFTWTGTSLFFSHWDVDEGAELWRSDGDAGTTLPVRNLRPGPEGGFGNRTIDELYQRRAEPRIAAVGLDRVVFSGDDGISGQELWTSDGTEEGTVLIADLMPGPDPSGPRHLVSAGGFAYFTAEEPSTGLELYRTDGTAGGTSRVRDIVPGTGSSIPEQLTVLDGVLYFSAWTPARGREVWRSDGTFSGTYRLTDVAPGPLSSSPSRFRRVGDLLLFVANDHATGFELWARPLSGSELLFADGFEAADARAWSAARP